MNVGDYVRTKDGIITKIIGNRKNPYGEETIFKLDKEISIYDLELNDMYLMANPLAEDTTNEIDTHFGDEKIFKKTSPNIIELLEKNDLVVDNYGDIYVVDYIFDNYVYTKTKQGNITKTLTDYQIKSIVTKEQFESMEYKVGE